MPATRVVKAHLYVDWDRNGAFSNETDRLVSASGNWRRNNPEDSITSPKGIISQCTITLINHDSLYSTLNTSSPLAAYLGDGGYYQVPIYITIEEETVETRIFTGVIKGPQETGGNLDAVAQITFDCRSREELLIQQKISSLQSNLKAYHDTGKSENGFIREWLTLAGVDMADVLSDPGNFIIPWAWLDNESPLEDIWQLAAAGGGAFYSNPQGQFVYENMSKWVDEVENAAYESFTDEDYKRGTVRINDDELYEKVIVEIASRSVAASAVVWEAQEQTTIPADSTKIIVATLRQPLYQLDAVSFTPTTEGGFNMTPYVTFSDVNLYAQRVEMEFTNTATAHNAVLRGLKIIGRSLNGGPTNEVVKASVDAFWTNRSGRTRTISNQYIQSQAQADALGNFLLDRHQKPRVFYTLADCPGKTSRRLGMRIVIRAGQLVSADRPALITGISWRFSAETGWTQTIEAFDCMDLFPYATTVRSGGYLAEQRYFRLGTSQLTNSTSFGDHRVFY